MDDGKAAMQIPHYCENEHRFKVKVNEAMLIIACHNLELGDVTNVCL